MDPRLRTPGLILVVCVLLSACKTVDKPTAQPALLEIPELGVAINSLPENFKVVAVERSRIVLKLLSGEGRLDITASESGKGVNLSVAIEEHKKMILARPGGEYKGGRKLVIPNLPGAAYYSRGRYKGAEGLTEETVVFATHPMKNRLLRVTYTYPAGTDTVSRLENELFPVVNELEGSPMEAQDVTDMVKALIEWVVVPILLVLLWSYGFFTLPSKSHAESAKKAAIAARWAGVTVFVLFVVSRLPSRDRFSLRFPAYGFNFWIIILAAFVGYLFTWLMDQLKETWIYSLVILILVSSTSIAIYSYFLVESTRRWLLFASLGFVLGVLLDRAFPIKQWKRWHR